MHEDDEIIGIDTGKELTMVSKTNIVTDWHHAFSYEHRQAYGKSATPKVQNKTKVKAKRRKTVLKKHK